MPRKISKHDVQREFAVDQLANDRLDIGKTARERMQWNDVMCSVADIAPFVSCRCFTGLDDLC
jgi:hypothetical protein